MRFPTSGSVVPPAVEIEGPARRSRADRLGTDLALPLDMPHASIAALRRIAQPREYSPSATDRPYRAVSIFVSLPLARAGATPNGITVAWILVGLAGVAAFLPEGWAVHVVGGVLLQLSYLLDFVDGEVARLSDRRSLTGGFLDLLGHGVIKASLPLAVGAAASWQTGSTALLLAGGIGSVVIVVGDTLRFYAACTVNELSGGDLGHTVVPRGRGGRRRPTLWQLTAVAFDLSFESPGLYGLALAAALADRLDVLAVYWAVGGFAWFCRRATTYCRRMA
jgi:phosphatidylglycerophosphate synthase